MRQDGVVCECVEHGAGGARGGGGGRRVGRPVAGVAWVGGRDDGCGGMGGEDEVEEEEVEVPGEDEEVDEGLGEFGGETHG